MSEKATAMESHQLINQDSGITEYYTPSNILDAARMTLGGFDLDPASSPTANRQVQAARIFTTEEDGLSQMWVGKVWLNWPFGKPENACVSGCTKEICRKRGYHLNRRKPGNADWVNKLVSEYQAGRVVAALCICFAATSEGWFRPLLRQPQCFLYGRTNFILPDGGVLRGVTKGSCITFFGPDTARFAECFRHLGEIKVPVFTSEGRLQGHAT